MGAALIILWNVAVLLVLYRQDPLDPFVNIALWLTLYMLAAHLFFSTYPTAWNRLLAVALPWQIAAIWRSEPFKARVILFRGAVVASIGALGIAGLAYQLSQPKNEPFVPYHSLIQVWLGDEGTGRDRAEQAINDYNLDRFLGRYFNDQARDRKSWMGGVLQVALPQHFLISCPACNDTGRCGRPCLRLSTAGGGPPIQRHRDRLVERCSNFRDPSGDTRRQA